MSSHWTPVVRRKGKKVQEETFIPTKSLGRLFGRGGANVKYIQFDHPGVEISVERKTTQPGKSLLRVFTHTSTDADVAACEQLVSDALAACLASCRRKGQRHMEQVEPRRVQRPMEVVRIAVKGSNTNGLRPVVRLATPGAQIAKATGSAVATVMDEKAFPALSTKQVQMPPAQKQLIEYANQAAESLLQRFGQDGRSVPGA